MKMTVERARLVAYWTWGCSDSSCGICRRAFDACCPDCKVPGDDCPVSKFENESRMTIVLFFFFFGCSSPPIFFAEALWLMLFS